MIQDLIRDLVDIRQWCLNPLQEDIPQVGLDYLYVNQDLIQAYLDCVYAVSEAEREAIQSAHKELDYTAVLQSHKDLAEQALREAKERRIDPEAARVAQSLTPVSEDDLHMLIRPIRYALYLKCSDASQDGALSMSPIEPLLPPKLS